VSTEFCSDFNQSFLDFSDIFKQHPINSLLHNTANIFKLTVIRAVSGYMSGVMFFTDLFFFILTHVAFVSFSQIMHKQILGELEI